MQHAACSHVEEKLQNNAGPKSFHQVSEYSFQLLLAHIKAQTEGTKSQCGG
jgi:hypothetical protein